jgi:hypothetical protein
MSSASHGSVVEDYQKCVIVIRVTASYRNDLVVGMAERIRATHDCFVSLLSGSIVGSNLEPTCDSLKGGTNPPYRVEAAALFTA